MTRRLTEMGKEVQSRLKRFFEPPVGAGAAPLEVVQAVLDKVERHVQPAGRGRRVFPCNRITVRAVTGSDRAAFEAVFGTLGARIGERLQELRCEMPTGLQIRTVWLRKAPSHWTAGQIFAVDFEQDAELASRPDTDAPAMPSVTVDVLSGAASETTYTIAEPVITIGRTAAVTDDHGRIRRNTVIFLDMVDGVTETVGRAHARLKLDELTREYRLFDDGSSNGTSLVRSGTSIHVPPRDPRGVRVMSGDEIHVGRAVLRIRL